MGLKEFLKPDKGKILISLLLMLLSVGLMFGIATTGSVALYIDVFIPVLIIFISLPIFAITAFFLLSYFFACYISKDKKWFKGILIYLVCFLIAFPLSVFLIGVYDDTVARSCSSDKDCRHVCGAGAVNNLYVPLIEPLHFGTCSHNPVAFCGNKKCKTEDSFEAESAEDCERMFGRTQDTKFNQLGMNFSNLDLCYSVLASKLNNKSMCNRIGDVEQRERCLRRKS
ncbi:hypothetical protein HYV82_04225 [Candidatus Woesearchaeota archaeon]|nr:hypothetical protein [Candidatus Woesearchaeota archaeon]